MFLEERWEGCQKGDEVGNMGGGTEMCSGGSVKTTSREGEASKSEWGKWLALPVAPAQGPPSSALDPSHQSGYRLFLDILKKMCD